MNTSIKDTHSVLFELQKNLEDLSSAKEQVELFRSKSSEITNGIADVQQQYRQHLIYIKRDYEERVNLLENKLNSFLESSENKSLEIIQEGVTSTEEKVNQGVESMETTSDNIKKSHDKNIKAVNDLLEQYESLVEETDSLIETLTQIDFPTKLDALTSKSDLIINSITSSQQALELKLYESRDSVIEKLNEQSDKLDTTSKQMRSSILRDLDEKSKSLDARLDKYEKNLSKLINLIYWVLGIVIIGIALSIIL